MFWIFFLKQKVGHFYICRPPNVNNLTSFFEELTISTKVTLNYENIIVAGDFNIGIECYGLSSNDLRDFYCLFHLANIVKWLTNRFLLSVTLVGDHTLVTSLIARLGPEVIVTHRKSVKDQYMISVMFII